MAEQTPQQASQRKQAPECGLSFKLVTHVVQLTVNSRSRHSPEYIQTFLPGYIDSIVV